MFLMLGLGSVKVSPDIVIYTSTLRTVPDTLHPTSYTLHIREWCSGLIADNLYLISFGVKNTSGVLNQILYSRIAPICAHILICQLYLSIIYDVIRGRYVGYLSHLRAICIFTLITNLQSGPKVTSLAIRAISCCPRNICIGFADVTHIRRESGVYVTQMLRAKFAYRTICVM
jgi:hypothetical protein